MNSPAPVIIAPRCEMNIDEVTHDHDDMEDMIIGCIKMNKDVPNITFITLLNFWIQEIEFRLEIKHAYTIMKFYENVSKTFNKTSHPVFL